MAMLLLSTNDSEKFNRNVKMGNSGKFYTSEKRVFPKSTTTIESEQWPPKGFGELEE